MLGYDFVQIIVFKKKKLYALNEERMICMVPN